MNLKMRIYRLLTRPLRGHNLDKYPSLIKLHDCIVKGLSNQYIDVNGYRMNAGKGDWLHYQYTGEYEPLTTQLIKDYIKPGDTVVDVGANIGYYTLLFSRLVGDTGAVFAFEPEPTNYGYLKTNIKLNGYDNIITEQKAIADKACLMKLFIHPDNPGGHTITDSYGDIPSITVCCFSMDDYFKDIKIDFVKIDVEGAEHLVIEGMSSLIRQGVKIVFEINAELSGGHEQEIFDLLEKSGYRFLFIDEKDRTTSRSLPVGKNVNVLCIK